MATSTATTLYGQLCECASQSPDHVACSQDGDKLTYAELVEQAQSLALGMLGQFNISSGDTVALIAENSFDTVIASYAVQALGAVELPLSTRLPESTIYSAISQCGCVAVIADTKFTSRKLTHQLKSSAAFPPLILLGKEEPLASVDGEPLASFDRQPLASFDRQPLASFDRHPLASSLPVTAYSSVLIEQGRRSHDTQGNPIETRQAALAKNDVAIIIRTSGTTGEPKSVKISHKGLLHNCRYAPDAVGLSSRDVMLCCLPFWHLYARLVVYMAFSRTARVEFGRLSELRQALQTVKPTIFPCFPMVWEDIYEHVMAAISRDEHMRPVYACALRVSRYYYQSLYRAQGKEVRRRKVSGLTSLGIWLTGILGVLVLAVPHWVNQQVIFRPIRQLVGGRLKRAIIGDAPLPVAIDLRLQAMGFKVLEAYGSSEQLISSIRPLNDNVAGTIGCPLPEVDLRIVVEASGELAREAKPGEVGEIAVAGPNVFPGYYGDAVQLRQSITLAGKTYYLTGDMGSLGFHGNLIFIGRKKHRLKLPDTGGFVYPELTENALEGLRQISHSMLFIEMSGAGEPLTSLLVVPKFRELLQRSGLLGTSSVPERDLPDTITGVNRFLEQHTDAVEKLLSAPAMIQSLTRHIQSRLKIADLPAEQRPQQFYLSPRLFRVGEELTPTLKLQRHYIQAHYPGALKPHPLGV